MPTLDLPTALALISPFLPHEWPTTDPSKLHLSRVQGGLINTLHLLRRDPSQATHEPAALLIRHFGQSGGLEEPGQDCVTLPTAQQALVHWEMGRRGWGPRVWGLFPGGRVEEFIEGAHTLTAEEAGREGCRRGVARAYARLHSLEFPFRRDGFGVVAGEFGRGVGEKRGEVLRALRGVEDGRAREYEGLFREVDWVGELEWVRGLFERCGCKVTLTHVDANYLNILVKGEEKNEGGECQVMLIDYETVSYGYRGFDIGGHFNERMYCYNQPDSQLSGYEAHSVEEQRMFCEEYLEELRRLRVRGSEGDTVEHLMLEAKIGRLYQILFTNMLCTVYDEVEVDPLFLSGLTHMMQTYGRLKSDLVRELGDLTRA